MNVAIVYVYPMVRIMTYFPLARRFADTWRQYPPVLSHRLHVVCNGANPGPNDLAIFSGIPAEFHPHDNLGWDIGAYQWAAEAIPCDLLVCLGAPVHFNRPGWLEKMVDAYVEHGPNLYGCWAYLHPNWHVRTTVFWLPPELLQSYPYIVGSTRASRYEFEHGAKSITRHVLQAGFDCIMVTTDGCFPFAKWRDHAPGVNNSLLLDQHVHQ